MNRELNERQARYAASACKQAAAQALEQAAKLATRPTDGLTATSSMAEARVYLDAAEALELMAIKLMDERTTSVLVAAFLDRS